MYPSTLITSHLDTWSSAIKSKSTAGRGGGKRQEFYGIKKLRELILELAVRGLLVPQDPKDEPASELLKKIAAEKAKLVKDRKMKKGNKTPPPEDEIPFEIPKKWTWTQLGEISEISPRNTLPDDLAVGFVPMPLVSTSYDGAHDQEIKKWGEIKKGYTHFANGDIAIAKITPCFENSKAAIFSKLKNGHGAGTTELHVARLIGEFVNPRFILLYLKAPMFLEKGKTMMTGSAGQKRVPASYFKGNRLPLPPLAEQHRIVAKVDELMALCDQLEQRQEDSGRTHDTLVQTLLGALTAAVERGQFQEAWQRIENNFDTLFTTENSITQLKQTILQLAVMGKLVEQDPGDESAEVLVKRIQLELSAGDRKRQGKAPPHISNKDFKYELPKTWAWRRFCDVAIISSNLVKPDKYIKYPHLAPDNIEKGNGVLLACRTVEEDKVRSSNHRFYPGQIVYSKIRPNLSKVVIVDFDGLCSADMYPIDALIDPNYLKTYMLSEPFLQQAVKNDTRVAMPKINQNELNAITVPVPPLAEQHRIVAKVDELMTLCDRLTANLQTAQDIQLNLADNLVEAAIR
ncbi:MAG: restriction endonuclease subunit S [Verrucomicrobia bacterium]|nr:restriction endonuclease subunit S [Verrucomicrobiota bacterium]